MIILTSCFTRPWKYFLWGIWKWIGLSLKILGLWPPMLKRQLFELGQTQPFLWIAFSMLAPCSYDLTIEDIHSWPRWDFPFSSLAFSKLPLPCEKKNHRCRCVFFEENNLPLTTTSLLTFNLLLFVVQLFDQPPWYDSALKEISVLAISPITHYHIKIASMVMWKLTGIKHIDSIMVFDQ